MESIHHEFNYLPILFFLFFCFNQVTGNFKFFMSVSCLLDSFNFVYVESELVESHLIRHGGLPVL